MSEKKEKKSKDIEKEAMEEEEEEDEILGWPFKGKAKNIWTFVRIAVSLTLVYCGTLIKGLPSWAELTMVIFAFVLIGYDVFLNAVKSIIHGEWFDETFLMMIATVSAMAIQSYDEAVFVLALYQLGEFFEDLASEQSKDSIARLINDTPLIAHVVELDGTVHDEDPEVVEIGQTLKILPGEKVPVDGKVISGTSTLDVSSLTGESLPQEVKEGSSVYSGSINGDGVLLLQVSKEFKDSTLSQVMDLIKDEEKNKAKSQRFIDKFAKIYTPSAIIIAVLTFVIGWAIRGFNVDGAWKDSLYQACNILIISCPCAIVISVPLAFFISIGRASRYGVLIKGGEALENYASSDTFVFDKTGTLTKGEFEVKEASSEEALVIIASLEKNSTHPIARSIVKAAEGKELKEVRDFKNIPGQGIKGTVDGKDVYVGDYAYVSSVNKNVKKVMTPYKVIYAVDKGEEIGYVIIADVVKENARKAMDDLKKNKVRRLVMLSGDNKEIASRVGQDLGLSEEKGELLPQEKLEELKKIKASSRKTVYVGDGVNDAPSLLAADVGVSMGSLGSDAANASADIVIMNDDLESLGLTKRIARKTMGVVFEDIIIPIVVKITIMVLAFCDISNMYLAVGADTGMTLLMILNDLRLWQKYKKNC